MFRTQREAVRLFKKVFNPPGPVLEIGSYLHLGFDHFANVRPLFSDREYVGCDIREGPGVDVLADAEDLSFGNMTFGTVLILEVLEHLRRPEAAVQEIHRVLTDDGFVALSVPFSFRLHAYPTDYWRFTASGIDTLLQAFPVRSVFALGPAVKPAFVFAVAGKQQTALNLERCVLFQKEIERTFSSPAARLQGHVSVGKGIGRDLFGWMLGRARVGVSFYEPNQVGGYVPTIVSSEEGSSVARARP
jgi:SAM-dependent methyltransferase